MNREEWIETREVQIAREMPDMFPYGYARFLAEQEWEEKQ